jgi:hypothetical protein
MDSWNTVRLLGSALLPRTLHLHGFATAGAMLTCVAIVLNVGPFANTTGKAPDNAMSGSTGGKVTSATEQPNAARSMARWDIDLHRHRPPSVEPEFAARMATLIHPTPFAVAFADVTPAASQPAELREAGDVEGRPAPPHSAEPVAQPSADQVNDPTRDAIVGVWAPGGCSARDFREGLLPTVINTEGAWAGETFCLFSKRKPVDTGWTVVAKCSNAQERWTSNVRLTVSDNRLTWTSRRGTQTYARCAPDVLMAQASSRP